MLETLLATKLYYPSVRPNLVARPRLTQQLAQVTSWPFTLVCAPAGYGKTTLVATGLAQFARDQVVAWLSLDEEDNDPVRFWVYVIAALHSVAPGVGEQALALLQSPQPATPSVVLTLLINDIAARPDPVVLVLDDYHTINAEPIHEGLAFLVERLPPQMHLVLISRIDPPLPLSRMRARGQLRELRAADLRFTPEEAAAFLQEVMGLVLTAGEVMALEARTEGWIAGLQLAALSMQGVDDLPGFINAFSGSHRHLVDYLTEEVFVRQPQPVQHFLLQTAMLDRFCAPLCDAVLGIGDWGLGIGDESRIPSLQSQELLEHLERTNLFLVPLDEQRRWYRYHHLFAELLRFRAGQILGADSLRQIHRRAALWFEAAAHWTEAIQHAIAAGDYDVAGRVVAHQAAQALVRGEVASLAEWLAVLPADQINVDARLKLAQAWVSLFNGEEDAAEYQLQEAIELIQRSGSSEAALMGEALAIRATLAMVRNDTVQNIADSEQALTLLPAGYLPLRSLVVWHLAFAFRSCGEAEPSIQRYHQAIALSEQGGNVLVNLSARRELAEVMIGQGDLHSAQTILTLLVEEATAEGWTHLYPVSAAYVHLGEIHYELNQLETAASYVQTGVALPNADFMSFDAYGCALLGHIHAAQGELGSAHEAIDQAERRVLRATHPQRRALTLACLTRFWLKQGEVSRAASWLPNGRDVPQDPRHEVYLRQQISRARYLLATDDKAGALQIVGELLAPAQVSGRVRDGVALRLLQAQLLEGEEAEAALRQALLLAEPAGLVRTIVDEGMVIGALLARLQEQVDISNAYLNRILAALPAASGSLANRLLVEPLSERELEVLRLMAEGYSNREIANKLVFTVATAKKHAEHIYGKLGVNSRTRAIARAHELDLL